VFVLYMLPVVFREEEEEEQKRKKGKEIQPQAKES